MRPTRLSLPPHDSVVELDLGDDRWRRFVDGAVYVMPCHLPRWAGMVAECYGFRSFALALVDGSGRVRAGLPVVEVITLLRKRRWVSLPFTDCCPAVGSSSGIDALIAYGDRARAERRISEFEVRAPLANGHAVSAGVMHALELQRDPEAVFRTFKKSQVQQPIRKADRDGVQVREAESPEDLTEIYYRLHSLTRRRLGVPVQPRRLFRLLWDRLVAAGDAFVLLAYLDDVPIAGAVFVAYGKTVTYKYAASHPGFLRYRPNNLVLWTAIRRSCEGGYEHFDFGRTDENDTGLRAFKAGWGTVETPLAYSVFSETPPAPRKGIGAPVRSVIRRSPVRVAQAVGTLFYKYAA
jgi:CelD/BcsL family acetyltransferase involved in cellulose biosynthesis